MQIPSGAFLLSPSKHQAISPESKAAKKKCCGVEQRVGEEFTSLMLPLSFSPLNLTLTTLLHAYISSATVTLKIYSSFGTEFTFFNLKNYSIICRICGHLLASCTNLASSFPIMERKRQHMGSFYYASITLENAL